MYATSDLEDALAATREFLWPFQLSRWWRLAVVALFLSSGTGLNPPTFEAGFPTGAGGGAPTEPMMPEVPFEAPSANLVALAIAIVLFAVLLGLVFAVVGAVMEFVLVESLREETVTVRRFFARRWRQGIRLFAFNVVLGIATFVVIGGLVAVGLAPLLVADSLAVTAVALVLLVPVVLAAGLLTAAAFGFTSTFVVPTMVIEDSGVLDGWRRFWPVLRREWKEYLAFALVYVASLIVAGIGVGIVVGIGAILLAIPFGVIAAAGFALLGTVEVAGIALLVVAGVLWLLSVIVLFAFVQVPVVTFLRYYSLFVLGDTEESLDLIPERREAVRGE